MINTLSTLVDSHHLFHPKQFNENSNHDHPTLFRRIAGIVLLAISVPLTLGIATGFFVYWAHKKVVHVKEQNRTELDDRTERVFGKAVQGTVSSEGVNELEGQEEAEDPKKVAFGKAIKAIQKGDVTAFKAAIQLEEFPSTSKEACNELYDLIVEHDRSEMVADVHGLTALSSIPLHKAKSAAMVKEIVGAIPEDRRKSFVNWNNYEGKRNTALHYQQNLDVVKALINAGAAFMPNSKGNTPLNLCTDPKIAEYLIDEFGPSILAEPRYRHPLFTVENVDVLRVIIQKMEKIDVSLDEKGHNILHFFTIEPLKNHPELIHDVLKRFESDEEREEFVNKIIPQLSPIIYWDELPVKVVAALIEAGAKYPEEESISTPLHSCTNPEIAELFIKKFGKDILELKDSNGRTPLMTVKSPEVQKLLIQKGAKVDVVESKYGMNTMFFAKSVEVAQMLFEKGVDPEALDAAQGNVFFGEITPEVAQWLIDEHQLKVDLKDNRGKEAIHCLHADNIAMAKVLIGDRDHEYDWGENVPLVMQNPDFVQWLKAGKQD